MNLLTLMITKFGGQKKLAEIMGKTTSNISHHNRSECNIHKNVVGFEAMLKSELEFNETITCDGRNITVKIKRV